MPSIVHDTPSATEAEPAPRPSRAGRNAALGFLVGAGIFAALFLSRGTRTGAPETPVATPTATPTPTRTPDPIPDPEPTAEPTPTPSAVASTGTLVPPAAAAGHRVFVDGRVVGEGTASIIAACGKHTVRIGSAGKDLAIEIPCGGEITLE